MQNKFYYGWIIVPLAACAMAATLPGRTHGLGLITKPLLDDFTGLNPESFAALNAWATLLGAAFCFPCGWLLDRFSLRAILAGVVLGLAAVLFWLVRVHDETQFAIALTRGLGQSMLSVVSITMVGKWFQKNLSPAMGVYAVLMSFLMAVAFGVVGYRVQVAGWRTAWGELAGALVAFVPLAWLLVRDRPAAETRELAAARSSQLPQPSSGVWYRALGTPCFWVFTGSISLFGMVSSGISLFQQFILESRGLDAKVFLISGVVGLLAGMATNLVAGGLARIWRLQYLLAGAMFILAGSLAMLPLLQTAWHAYAYAVVHGIAGGTLTVLFFAVWGHAFGPTHLGRIQGAAQMMTVLASALGPLVVADSQARSASYAPILWTFAALAALFAIAAAFTPVPDARAETPPEPAADSQRLAPSET